jgi:tetratricopeptide (TPR) repeat protein
MYFRAANVIFTDLPHVMENMGVIFANSGFDDSAVVYFEQAAKVAEPDTSLSENRNSATLNQAMVLQRLGRHPEAIAVLHKYLGWKPGDLDAKKSLAQSFREAGMADSADALDQEMIAEFTKMNLDSLSTGDLMSVGVSMFNAAKYQESADVFTKLTGRNAWSRDAVYNLANAYLALKNWDKLLETGKHLMEIEPMSEDSYRLVGQAYRELKQQDNLLRTAEVLVGLPVNIEIAQFTMGRSSGRLSVVVTGRSPTDVQSKPIKPTPVTLVFEFLNETGAVVGTSDAEVPALEPDKRHELRAEAGGAGIVAWRYKRK